MFALDLGRCAVFLDYDGTISAADTCVHLLERLAAPGWKAIAVNWLSGELEFAHSDLSCPCASCGTCKQAPIREATERLDDVRASLVAASTRG